MRASYIGLTSGRGSSPHRMRQPRIVADASRKPIERVHVQPLPVRLDNTEARLGAGLRSSYWVSITLVLPSFFRLWHRNANNSYIKPDTAFRIDGNRNRQKLRTLNLFSY